MAEEEEAMETGENGQDQSDLVERRANRIMKIFGQLTECLEDVKVARIKEMLSQIIDICKNKGEKPVKELNKIYLEYLVMVEFRAGISVNLIKLSIQSFLMIEDDPENLGGKVNEKFLEMILTEHPTLALDMKLSDELLKTYFRLLSEGSEPALHMRLMVVGMFGVGKTSLVRRLCGKNVDDVESTEGIDIFTETCEVREDGDWIISPDKDREQVFNTRLQALMDSYGQKKEDPVKEDNFTFVRRQTSTDQPENTWDKGNTPNTPAEPDKRDFNYKEFSEKVDERDLKERTDRESPQKIIRRPTVSIWDFAGQSVYYSTHHFFLNERSIYLLVLDLSKELDEKVVEDNNEPFLHDSMMENRTTFTCMEAFKFWIKSIYIYTKQKEMHSTNTREYSPKIVLIGTHKDKITEKQLNKRSYEKYKDDYFEKALLPFTNRPMAKLVHPKTFLINNTTPSANEILEFIEVKREIFNITKTETQFLNEPIPAQYIPLERAVFHSKRNNKKIMRFGELQEENRKLEFPSSEKAIEVFLAFQHAFGNVIYFNTDALHDTVILTPQWIINAFKAFVSHKPNKKASELDKWQDLKERGILREELIEKLLEPHTDLLLFKDQVVKYMEHMDVIVRPVLFQTKPKEPFDDNTLLQNDGDKVVGNFYILPCVLPPIPKSEELKICFNWCVLNDEILKTSESNTPTLCLYFKECFLPPFVVHRLLASFVKKMQIKTLIGKQILYNGLGSFVFQDKEDRYLTLWSFEDILHFKISFIDQISDKEKTQFCIFWRERIEQLVLEIFNFHGKEAYSYKNISNLFDYRIKCPKCEEQMPCEQKVDPAGHPYDYMYGLFSVSDLKGRKQCKVQCSACNSTSAANGILQDWFIDDVSEIEECLCALPQEDKLADLSEEIPNDMIKRLAVQLCIKETAIERLEKAKFPAACFTYRVLHLWKKRCESWNVVYEALPKAGIHIEKDKFFKIIRGDESDDDLETMKQIMKQLENVRTDIDEALLPRLADCIGEEFWLLGVRLGIKDTDIQKMMVNCNCNEVCWEILKKWLLKADPCTKFNVLIKMMIKSGTDMSEVIDVLKTTG